MLLIVVPAESLTFSDNRLKDCVDNAAIEHGLGLINQISEMNCDNYNITSFTGIEKLIKLTELTKLKSLDIASNSIADITPLADLAQLTSLSELKSLICFIES